MASLLRAGMGVQRFAVRHARALHTRPIKSRARAAEPPVRVWEISNLLLRSRHTPSPPLPLPPPPPRMHDAATAPLRRPLARSRRTSSRTWRRLPVRSMKTFRQSSTTRKTRTKTSASWRGTLLAIACPCCRGGLAFITPLTLITSAHKHPERPVTRTPHPHHPVPHAPCPLPQVL